MEQTDTTINSTLPAALVTKVRLRDGVDATFSAWHAKAATAPAGVAGFISTEVEAPSVGGGSEWSIIQHFRTADAMRAWRATEAHRELIESAKTLVNGADASSLREEEVGENQLQGVVTEVVTTQVKPGKDAEYQAWAEKVHSAEAQFPGYRGSFLQPPATDRQHYWTTLVRFGTPEQLDAWLNSDVRRDLLKEHDALVQTWEHHRLPSSFAGWFPTDPATGQSPASWKQSLLVVLMLFPIVVLEIKYLTPLINGFNVSVQTFIGNVISVFLLAWPFMPIIIRLMNWWLLPSRNSPKWITPAGMALLAGLYAVEIVVLSWLV